MANDTICDIVKYERDIAPFPLVKIYSGVGSGKSYFASKMITGSKEYGIPEQNVLIITSRRSKVEETLKEMGVLVKNKITKNGNLCFDMWQDGLPEEEYEKYLKEIKCVVPDYGEMTCSTYNKSVVCTNAFISAYLRNVHNPDDAITHIWNKFDAIIVDEVHSLVTDATYQTATFDVFSLLVEYLRLYKNNQLQECACKHLILMTGTPQPFEHLVDLDFPEHLTNKIDLFDKCKNVVPTNVILIDEHMARKRIRELLSTGEKVIYFTNHTLTESMAKEKFALSDAVNVGVSFSDESKRNLLSNDERKKFFEIDNSLTSDSFVPDYVQFFVTTSRNKEGINIHNTDLNHMFVETHLMYDVVQMVGRVRLGVENLYIISNAEQFNYYNNLTDILFSKKVMVANNDYISSADEANIYLAEQYLENNTEKEKSYEDRRKNLMNYVKYIENRFAYVKYNVFRQRFEFYALKEKAETIAENQKEAFEKMLLSDNTHVSRWFPKSFVKRELSAQELGRTYLNNILKAKPYIKLSKDEFKKHLITVRELFDSDLTSAKPILKLVDEKFNFTKLGDSYLFYYGTEDPRTKKKSMRKRRKR